MGKKGDLDFVMSSNPDKAIADMSKVLVKQEGMIQKLKESNRESKKLGKNMSGVGMGAGSASKRITEIGLGFASAATAMRGLQGVVSLMKLDYAELMRMSEKVAQANAVSDSGTLNWVTGWSKDADPDMINAKLQVMAGQEKVPKKLLDDLGGIVTGANQTIPEDRLMDVIRTFSKGDVHADARLMGRIGGKVSKIGAYKSTSGDDLADITQYLVQNMGEGAAGAAEGFKGISTLEAAGVSPDIGFGMMLSGSLNNQKMRGLSSIASLVRKYDPVKKKKGKKFTRKEEIQNRLAVMTPDEQIGWMMDSPDDAEYFYGSTFLQYKPFLDKAKIQQGRAGITAAQQENLFSKMAASSTAVHQKGRARQTVDAVTGNMLIGNAEMDSLGFTKSSYEKLLDSDTTLSGKSKTYLRAKLAMWGTSGADPTDMIYSDLQSLEKRYRTEKITTYDYAGPNPSGRLSVSKNPSYNPNQAEGVRAVREAIERYAADAQRQQEMYELAKEQLAATDKQTAATKELTQAVKNNNTNIVVPAGAVE